ncbi:aminomethyl-transferring glycine dehydrogenase subunit GcvPB [Desulforhopalus singaporensis]|uniref:glycine dehydrogenase (aminomethyl-transferring) n=1 Tax=Desulforhopalus singaporensis TaxID=91360 RepID=A0A1H0PSK4_9BACT|nr:aminomethyl-transferring glycine dehydrogenase subunit GcvPB [Desulforhopalus singaporensis]SDP08131.1 glycine dehydrogenase (decarboxylating) beta subunit [Desulforhopalus singaporensis]
MKYGPGRSGLIMEEPLLWEKGRPGRNGMSIPDSDVPDAQLAADLCGEGPDFPDLSEVDVVRHYTRLSQWNFGVDTGMYPLGSCTMKYNPKINEKHAASEGITSAHPMLDDEYCQGTLRIIYELQNYLAAITGLDAVSVQPAAGAHGELAGMLIFAAYHKSRGKKRNKILIPDTAHGTNPASAALCGYKPVSIKSGPRGILDVDQVRELMDEECAGIMITNPNTLGLFEENIREIAQIVHEKGGLVYGDGANMNAVMGIVDMKKCGVDVLHLNLHKTFSTPHGGGGPGSGPVCVVEELAGFLPSPRVVFDGEQYRLEDERPESIGRMHCFHGNYGVLVRALCYILTMGAENLKKATQYAVLNACYIKVKLKNHLHLAYDRPCMHEAVFSDKKQQEYKVTTLDIAKRLMDSGYHPPTIYFPLVVHGAIMIEPTETESLEELDTFIEVVKEIVAEAKSDAELLKNAPQRFKVKRLDETQAARQPCLCG